MVALFLSSWHYPVAMIKALRAIIHEKGTVKEANDIFEQEKSKVKK